MDCSERKTSILRPFDLMLLLLLCVVILSTVRYLWLINVLYLFKYYILSYYYTGQKYALYFFYESFFLLLTTSIFIHYIYFLLTSKFIICYSSCIGDIKPEFLIQIVENGLQKVAQIFGPTLRIRAIGYN